VTRSRRGWVVVVCAIAATSVTGASEAASTTWASRADKVCTVWAAKAKAALGTASPKTATQAYEKTVKATGLERAELAALTKIPKPTPAGMRALASVRTDLAEITIGINEWRTGNKTGFLRVYTAWQKDFRPHRAFLAAAAKACG
jgi:hypothetical protein